jgi:hypothetical protein
VLPIRWDGEYRHSWGMSIIRGWQVRPVSKDAAARDLDTQGELLATREDMAALHTFEIPARAVVIDAEVATAMWTRFEEHHRIASQPCCAFKCFSVVCSLLAPCHLREVVDLPKS